MRYSFLKALGPFRRGAVMLPRGAFRRKACVAILKAASRHLRPHRYLDEVRPLDAPDLSFVAVDSMVIDTIYWFGLQGYEGLLADLWRRLCRDAENVLEVGGNIGLYTIVGAKATQGRYTVVEPIPKVVNILKANLRRNQLDDVEVIEAAAIPGTDPQYVELSVPCENHVVPVGAHLTRGVEVTGRISQQVIRVRGMPFEIVVKNCDLVKIDAEGIEHALLESARTAIAAARPTLVVEVLPEAAKLVTLLRELARDARYQIHIVPAYGSDRIVSVSPSDFSGTIVQQHNSKDVVLTVGPLPT